jgi:XRE family transcriptional regulator, regulator of sulfur utilization
VIFGERLRELRRKRGLTLDALAEAADMSLTYVSNLETGVKVPSLTTLIRLAAALKCKVPELVSGAAYFRLGINVARS